LGNCRVSDNDGPANRECGLICRMAYITTENAQTLSLPNRGIMAAEVENRCGASWPAPACTLPYGCLA